MPVRSEFLHTAHLVLSPFSPDDAERAMDMLTDQAIGRTYMLPEFPSREASRPLFERLFRLSQNRDRFIYSIRLQDELIGWINETENAFPVIEVGYVVHPSFQNQGYATEALQAAIHELFGMGYTRIRAGFFAGNTPSQRVMEKSGMQPTGETVEIPYRNALHTCILFEIQKPS